MVVSDMKYVPASEFADQIFWSEGRANSIFRQTERNKTGQICRGLGRARGNFPLKKGNVRIAVDSVNYRKQSPLAAKLLDLRHNLLVIAVAELV